MKIRQKLSGHAEITDDSEDSITTSSLQDSLRSKLIRLRMCQKGGGGKEGETKKALVVNGPTLLHALDPLLKKLFLEVADKFHSVLCCRATPLQKVYICIQYKPVSNKSLSQLTGSNNTVKGF